MKTTSRDPSPAILLLGDTASGKDSILRALLGDSKTQTIFFDTKYYTAKASITSAEDLDPYKDSLSAWEALVLVFDTARLVASCS